MYATPAVQASGERAGAATDVQEAPGVIQQGILRDHVFLAGVQAIHAVLEEAAHYAPIAASAMCDVVVVVVGLDSRQRDSRLLVDQRAFVAGNERESTRFSGEIVLGRHERASRVRAAQIARRGLEILNALRVQRRSDGGMSKGRHWIVSART